MEKIILNYKITTSHIYLLNLWSNQVLGIPYSMSTFLEKHFNKELDDNSRKATLDEYPKLNCSALIAL